MTLRRSEERALASGLFVAVVVVCGYIVFYMVSHLDERRRLPERALN